MKLSPWFHVGKYGAPVNLGWYDFDAALRGDSGLIAGVPLESTVMQED